jgi:hypothetical protein
MSQKPAAALLVSVLLAASPALAYRPYPPYPPYPAYPPPPPPPVRVVDPTPPPLSPAMRIIYAPFYAAGLVLRYGFYYALVAPIEVLTRTVAYGAEGGVERRPPPPRQPPPSTEEQQ